MTGRGARISPWILHLNRDSYVHVCTMYVLPLESWMGESWGKAPLWSFDLRFAPAGMRKGAS